ncbi:hypothetical protein [Silvanigrella aquatica]|uniref:Uncharacterized protein n=1 Tax=Silvanigrella aquatica TaxID=1915309 RepID=A0A1L4D0W2_9BACT|nr:hypothetical protein [Silvanigrella aquatica]APJ03824.1 hypothetical protein AXG55_07860 [Silvanigrella aquatica]
MFNFNMNKNFLIRSLLFMVFINGCSGADNNYYQINKVRVVASLVQSANVFSGTASQQFPIRINNSGCTSAQQLNIVVISPTNETPSLTMNNIILFALGNNYLSGGGGARGVAAGTTGISYTPSTFLQPAAVNPITAVQTTPFRITVFRYDVQCIVTTTNLINNYMAGVSDFPGFQMNYTVSSAISSDQGEYSFYFLPDPTDSWWSTSNTPSYISSSKWSQVQKGLAVTNNPIQITSVTPSSSTISGRFQSTITANLNSPSIPSPRDSTNPIYAYGQRVQWYVSSGNLNLDTASSTTWNPSVSSGTTVGGFVVVRDLLGGVDFKILGPFTAQ